MNKAVLWNINGVGFDAREAAREAARRQGKSLGEWLHGVIADHAADLGLEEHEIDGQDRIAAITSRLERLGARKAPFERRPTSGRGEDAIKRRTIRPERDVADSNVQDRDLQDRSLQDRNFQDRNFQDLEPGRRAIARREDVAGADDHRTSRAAPVADEGDVLIEEAMNAVEHRAQRVEKRTDNALASFAKMLEANEAKRDREREAVLAMGRKLSDIETRLSAAPADDSPIKGALARLEARLDTISRRGVAETTVGQSASTAAEVDAPLRRLEEKVNSILHVVARQQASSPAIAAKGIEAEPLRAAPVAVTASPAAVLAAQGAAPLPHRRLGDAIADISRRQRSLDDGPASPRNDIERGEATPLETERGGYGRLPAAPQRARPGETRAETQSEIAALAGKIEDMRREMAGRGQPRVETAADVAGLRSDIATMSQTLRGLAPRGSVTAIEDSIKALTLRLESSRAQVVKDAAKQAAKEAAIEAVSPALDVVGDLRRALAEIDPRKTIASLQNEVRSIGGRIEGLNAAGIDRPALDRLQKQMHDIRDMLAASAGRSLDVEHIEGELSALVERMDQQMRQSGATQDFATAAFAATTDDIRQMIAAVPGAAAFDKIERRLEALAAKVDASIETSDRHADRTRSQLGSAFNTLAQASAAAAVPSAADMSGLERLVRELGDKIEAVRAPGAGPQAIEALQHQITALSSRFDDAEGGSSSLATIERAMGDLFAHLEETRASVDTAAARAAREALRIAAAEGYGAAAPNQTRNEHELAVLRSLQDEADKRTHATLNAVHETLEKVVGRLSTMEGDIAQVRAMEVRATEVRATDVRAAEVRATEVRAHAGRPRAEEDDRREAARRPGAAAADGQDRPARAGGSRPAARGARSDDGRGAQGAEPARVPGPRLRRRATREAGRPRWRGWPRRLHRGGATRRARGAERPLRHRDEAAIGRHQRGTRRPDRPFARVCRDPQEARPVVHRGDLRRAGNAGHHAARRPR